MINPSRSPGIGAIGTPVIGRNNNNFLKNKRYSLRAKTHYSKTKSTNTAKFRKKSNMQGRRKSRIPEPTDDNF